MTTTKYVKTKRAKVILGATSLGSIALTDPSFAAAQTFLGDKASISFRQGVTTAQVQITVDNGKITDIKTVSLQGTPGWPASCINPTITTRALAAQSSNINGLSCASYSSAAWRQSLASAISKASAVFVQPKTTSTPIPITPSPNAGGKGFGDGDHEGFEGFGGDGGEEDDGYRPSHRQRPPHSDKFPMPRPTSSKKATPSPTATSSRAATTAPASSATPKNELGLIPGVSNIQKSIICVKGTTTKTVKAVNPKCPTGFTLKKK